MKIISKFKIGDEAWITLKGVNTKCMVSAISYYAYAKQTLDGRDYEHPEVVTEKYEVCVKDATQTITLDERYIFATEQELIDYLANK